MKRAFKVHVGAGPYSAIGHKPETYSDPIYRRMLANALEWACSPQSCAIGK